MRFKTATKSPDFTPTMKIIGWACFSRLSNLLKRRLDAERIILCASNLLPSSQTRVTSLNSLSDLRFPKISLRLSWNPLKRRQKLSLKQSLRLIRLASTKQYILFRDMIYYKRKYLQRWNGIFHVIRMRIEESCALGSEVLHHNDTNSTFCSPCP